MIRALLKILVVLALLAAGGVVVFAYLGDLSPIRDEIRQPVDLDVD